MPELLFRHFKDDAQINRIKFSSSFKDKKYFPLEILRKKKKIIIVLEMISDWLDKFGLRNIILAPL